MLFYCFKHDFYAIQQKYNKIIIFILLGFKAHFLCVILQLLTMIYLLLIFAIGILLGRIFQKQKRLIRFSSKLTFLSVLALLFLLGYQAGNTPEIKTQFETIGLKAITISILSLTGSIFFVYIFNKLVLKK